MDRKQKTTECARENRGKQKNSIKRDAVTFQRSGKMDNRKDEGEWVIN